MKLRINEKSHTLGHANIKAKSKSRKDRKS